MSIGLRPGADSARVSVDNNNFVDDRRWKPDGTEEKRSRASLHFIKCLHGFTTCTNRCTEDQDGICEEYEILQGDEGFSETAKGLNIDGELPPREAPAFKKPFPEFWNPLGRRDR
jgi:hypothetical protein